MLVGLIGEGRRAARAEYSVHGPDDDLIGVVTSGVLSPTLGVPIAMAYVERAHAAAGTALSCIVRDKAQPVTVSAMPFVPHRYHRG